MITFPEFFSCCGKDNKEQEVTVSVGDRRRAHSEGNKKTVGIKRSIGKSNKNYSGGKNENSLTIITATGASSHKHHSATKRRQGITLSATLQVSGHSKGHNTHVQDSRKNHHLNRSQSQMFGMQQLTLEDHIIQHKNNNETARNIESYPIQTQPPAIKGTPPRLLVQRRAKQKQLEMKSLVRPDKQPLKLNTNKRYPLIVSSLEPIEQRLSLLSCSESQAFDLSGMKDRSSFKEVSDRLPEISPITQKFGSCMFERQCFQTPTLKTAKSEHIQSFQRRFLSENESLILNKLKVDIEIHEKELKELQGEEEYLISQSNFTKKAFEQKLVRLQYLKKQLLFTLKELQTAKKEGKIQSKKTSGNQSDL